MSKVKAAKAELNEKTDIKTPISEMIRKFKKQKNAVVALAFYPVLGVPCLLRRGYCAL